MYEHLQSDIANSLKLSKEERIEQLLQPRWIGHPQALKILSKLDDLIKYPRQDRMPGMLIIGQSNNGKTKLIKRFASKYPVDQNINGESIIAPVLVIQSPATPSESGLYTEILNALYEKLPSASVEARRTRALDVMDRIGLKVLIIDELHNFMAGASLRQQQFLNIIKYISNQLNISIVGCGTPELVNAVSSDLQIQNRFEPNFLPNWKCNREFQQLLMSFERLLPLKKPSNLHSKLLASKIYAMCEGTIGEVSTLLNYAARQAIETNEECITSDVLEKCTYKSPSDRASMKVLL